MCRPRARPTSGVASLSAAPFLHKAANIARPKIVDTVAQITRTSQALVYPRFAPKWRVSASEAAQRKPPRSGCPKASLLNPSNSLSGFLLSGALHPQSERGKVCMLRRPNLPPGGSAHAEGELVGSTRPCQELGGAANLRPPPLPEKVPQPLRPTRPAERSRLAPCRLLPVFLAQGLTWQCLPRLNIAKAAR